MSSPTTLYDSKGQPVRLGPLIAKGGEGSVFEIQSRPTLVAKVYTDAPGSDRTAKLRYMVENQSPDLLRLAAWPVGSLHRTSSGLLAGLVMPRITDARKIHELYTPTSRKTHFPEANWAFLIHAAANTARAFAVVHQHGHVVGDVNHSNLLINRDGTVRLIDCDSFEIVTPHGRFRCGVGVPDYTPPELMGKDFALVNRTENHDLFGLAVLIFHLLMLGRHPYSGVYLNGAGSLKIGQAIKEHRFAYGSNAIRYQISAPPKTLPITALPPSVINLFETAFGSTASTRERPTATTWIEALSALSRSLKICARTDHHRFSSHLSVCPWCALEQISQTIAFPIPTGGATRVVPPISGQLDAESLWRAIEAITRPGPVPSLTLSGPVTVTDDVARLGRTVKQRRGVTVLALIVVEAIVLVQLGIGVLALVALVVGLILVAALPGFGAVRTARSVARKEFAIAETAWKSAEARWTALTVLDEFDAKRTAYADRMTTYRALGEQEKTRIAEVRVAQDRRQRELHLSRHRIGTAPIIGIGPQRAATLAQHGIATAADISYARVIALPGFGEVMASNLVAWQTTVNSRYAFNPSAPEVQTAVQDIRARIASDRRIIESELRTGAAALRAIGDRIEQHRSTLRDPTLAAMRRYELARATAKALH